MHVVRSTRKEANYVLFFADPGGPDEDVYVVEATGAFREPGAPADEGEPARRMIVILSASDPTRTLDTSVGDSGPGHRRARPSGSAGQPGLARRLRPALASAAWRPPPRARDALTGVTRPPAGMMPRDGASRPRRPRQLRLARAPGRVHAARSTAIALDGGGWLLVDPLDAPGLDDALAPAATCGRSPRCSTATTGTPRPSPRATARCASFPRIMAVARGADRPAGDRRSAPLWKRLRWLEAALWLPERQPAGRARGARHGRPTTAPATSGSPCTRCCGPWPPRLSLAGARTRP